MTLEVLISSLKNHIKKYPFDQVATEQAISWIEKYGDFAFVKDNLEGHLTGSMIITNPEMTKVMLMLHKKFGRWQQFGGHCDGEKDVRRVAIREFHEESGVQDEIEILPGIFHVEVHHVPLDAKGRPPHFHFDFLYLGIIPENIKISYQKSEVDGVEWFPLEAAVKINDEALMRILIQKIHNLKASIGKE